jgi:predicted Zn-dependent peptidase
VKATARTFSLLLILALFALPSFAEDTADNPFAGFETHILPNGLKVWYKRMPGQGNAALSVAVQAGSDRDPEGKEQMAHFLEHLLFSDHQGLTGQQIKKQIEDRGGVWNGYTSVDRTFYFVHIKKEHALFALDWLYRIVSPHEMKPEVVERERQPVEVEVYAKPREIMDWINVLYLNPRYLRFPGLWRREFNLETTEGRDFYTYRSLRAITPSDLKEFYERYYSPSRMTVTVIGDLDRDAVLDLVNKTFVNLRQVHEPPASPKATDVGRRRSTYSFANVSNINYDRNIRFANLDARDQNMLNFIGRFLRKRLNDRLRFGERKAAYGIYADLARRGSAAYFYVGGTIREEEFDFATSVIEEEIEALRKGSHSDSAFEAERSVLMQQLLVSYSTPESLESLVGWDFSDRDRYTDFPDLLKVTQTVSKAEIAAFTSEHFVPEREFTSTTYPLPLSQATLWAIAVAIFFATVRGMRMILTRPVEMKRIRYVAHIRIPKGMYVVAGAVLVLGIAIGLRLFNHLYFYASYEFLRSQNSFVLQWSLWGLLIAVNIAAVILGLALVPSKILVFDDRLLVKYFAYRSVSIPLTEIEDLSLQRFPGVWLSRRLWKCTPFKWGLLSPGIYLKRRSGRSYFFDVRDRKELMDLLNPSSVDSQPVYQPTVLQS